MWGTSFHDVNKYKQRSSTRQSASIVGEHDETTWSDPVYFRLFLGSAMVRVHDMFAQNHQMYSWLVVSTHLKNISQIGNLP